MFIRFHVLKGNGYTNTNHYIYIDNYSNRYPYPNKYSNSNENRDTDTYINTFGERHRETSLCKDCRTAEERRWGANLR